MTIACILCSIGGVVATLAAFVLAFATDHDYPRLAVVMLVLLFVGASSCAAEDRVCELAQVQP